MKNKLLIIYLLTALFIHESLLAQNFKDAINIKVANKTGIVLKGVSVKFVNNKDSVNFQQFITNDSGLVKIVNIKDGNYYFIISHLGYTTFKSSVYSLPFSKIQTEIKFTLASFTNELNTITVNSKKPFLQNIKGKTIINVEAIASNAWLTVLDVLEKTPGVIVDRNGIIALQGKNNVLVMIDDKPTYLSGADLTNMLSNMNSSSVELIELITNPSAKYDASGNAGIINIKTKKNQIKGFNGALTIGAGQGRYSKINDNIVVNFKKNALNVFFNYSYNYNKNFNYIYALRNYFNASSITTYLLEQPSYLSSNGYSHSLKSGVDYSINKNTTIGINLTGVFVNRTGNNESNAMWEQVSRTVDSTINTTGNSSYQLQNGVVNFNVKQILNSKQDLSFDVDVAKYDIQNEQKFTNHLVAPSGYYDANKGSIPSTINIFSAKSDYTYRLNKGIKLEAGFKTSFINTNNVAAYQYYNGSVWQDDLSKSNQFLYDEKINALYTSYEQKLNKISFQVGIRYEHTHYNAHQLGNLIVKDSSFYKNYDGLFPSGYFSYQADSNNTVTLTFGRRIDRPPFQKLNPFTFLINKYTYQTGNPFILPQNAWNFEVNHQYKQMLTSTIAFSVIKDYFSQIFPTSVNNILIYTEGNVGRIYNFSVSETVQLSPFSWWNVITQALFNYKELKGYVWNNYNSSIAQLYLNANSQFKIGKGIVFELSGNYITKARNDLQELLYPTGQVSTAFSMPVLKKKATLRLNFRDIFYTQAMEGLTDFQHANEYFILLRDTRVINISFTYRFGKQYKIARRSTGAANEEIQRASN